MATKSDPKILAVKNAIKNLDLCVCDDGGAEKAIKRLRKVFGIPEPKPKKNDYPGAW